MTLQLDPVAITETLFELGSYSLSWLAYQLGLPESSDGILGQSEWNQAMKRILASGLDLDGDGIISDQEWDQVVGQEQLVAQGESSCSSVAALASASHQRPTPRSPTWLQTHRLRMEPKTGSGGQAISSSTISSGSWRCSSNAAEDAALLRMRHHHQLIGQGNFPFSVEPNRCANQSPVPQNHSL